MARVRYGDHLRADLERYWNAYPEAVSPFWRVMMMLFQWELHAVIIYRINFHVTRLRVPLIGPLLGYGSYVAQKLNETVSGVRLPASVLIGPGLFIVHAGSVGVHPLAQIGANFTISPGASIIGKIQNQARPAMAVIGDNVFLGSGARIVGSVRVGNDVVIGANAVVVTDLPDGAVAVGNPARVIRIYDQPVERETRQAT